MEKDVKVVQLIKYAEGGEGVLVRSNGQANTRQADIDWFEYQGLDCQ